jgi:Fe-S cluster biogenesis protein NfuA
MRINTDPAFLKRIEDALEQLRPYLQADNGNVSLLEVTDDMVVKLRFHGACRGCSMSMMTLRAGIEQTVLRMVPEVKAVEAVDVQEDELI